jgi:Holliday junction resolvase RusA-like endonuclease
VIDIVVFGKGKPAGALAIGRRKDGGAFLRHRDGGDLADWKNAIKDKAGDAMRTGPYDGPVAIDGHFYFARPKGHYGTGRNATQLKPSAPPYPTTRANGDSDKLARAVLDAVTGVVIRDDSQVVDLRIRKRYADGSAVRLQLKVWALDDLDVLFAQGGGAAA